MYLFLQLLQGLSVTSVAVIVSWCLNIQNPVLKWVPNSYLIPILVRLLDYPEDMLISSLRIATTITLTSTILYVFYLTPSILRFSMNALQTWHLLTRHYGNVHGIAVLATNLFDPIQFILFWIALFFNQIWLEYIKFQEKNLDMGEIGEWYILLLLIVSEICYR